MKKKLAMIFVVGMALSFSIGCSVFGAEAEQYSERMDKTKQQFDMAKVVEVNEGTLVVTLAKRPEFPEGEKPEMPPRAEGEDGERPERPPRAEGEDGERPERPPMTEGEDGERPEKPLRTEDEDGERPRHGMMKELNFGEEKIEITLDETVEIHKNGEEQGSIAEIKTDDVIRICYAEDGETVESIFVKTVEKEQ